MSIDLTNAASPSLLRRLAAIFYDSWLVAGIWLLAVIIDTVVRDEQGLGVGMSHVPLQLFVVAAPFAFFGWFWTHGGQTLGMSAWRMRLLTADGGRVSWRQAIVRVAGACLSTLAFGLGYLWMLIDGDGLTWHDRLSGTRLVMTTKD